MSGKFWRMSPTVYREGSFRFFFFSREERRLHIHVRSPSGEAKFWIEPEIALARNKGLSEKELGKALEIIKEKEHDIKEQWDRRFGSAR